MSRQNQSFKTHQVISTVASGVNKNTVRNSGSSPKVLYHMLCAASLAFPAASSGSPCSSHPELLSPPSQPNPTCSALRNPAFSQVLPQLHSSLASALCSDTISTVRTSLSTDVKHPSLSCPSLTLHFFSSTSSPLMFYMPSSL